MLKKDLFLVNAQYYQLYGDPVNIPYTRKDVYKIWLINSESNLHFADKTIYINQPALIFSNPLVPYAFDGLSRERSGYWCTFSEEFIKSNDRMEGLQDSPLFKVDGDNVFFLDEIQLKKVTHLFDNIIAELQLSYINKYDAVKSYVNLLIHESIKLQQTFSAKQPINAASRITNAFLELLERQFPIETPQQPLIFKMPGDFADKLSVHVNHLNAVVKEATGKSTSEHIMERTLNEAKALLKHTAWSIADIGFGLGFEYPNHFNNFFKKHTGLTPLSFRKKNIL